MIRPTPLLAAFTIALAGFPDGLLATELVRDTFAGIAARQDAGWYASTEKASSAIKLAAERNFPSGQSLYFDKTSGNLWKTFPSGTVDATVSLTLSFEFRDVSGHGLSVGLFNNAGTPAPAADGRGSHALEDDRGFFLLIKRESLQIVRDEGDGGVFFGKRTPGPTVSYAPYGTASAHTLSLTLSRQGSTLVATAVLNGVHNVSLTADDMKFSTANQVVFSNLYGTTGNFRIGDLTISLTPPAP